VTPDKTNFTANRVQDAIPHPTLSHLETSKVPSFSASTNALNILTKSRKRRIQLFVSELWLGKCIPGQEREDQSEAHATSHLRAVRFAKGIRRRGQGAKLPVL
jgi:hypothetical protein